MSPMESNETNSMPDLVRLQRLTRPPNGDAQVNEPARDAFLAMGESIDAASRDFDWRRIAANLEVEFSQEGKVTLRAPHLGRTPTYAWVRLASAAMLLVALSIGLGTSSDPSSPRPRGRATSTVKVLNAPNLGIDSWEPTTMPAESSAAWHDELDVELAQTRQALRQGRDPWVNDEPGLSQVFAQIGDLTAGLVFEPF